MIYHDAVSHRYIEGLLHPAHGKLNSQITEADDLIGYAIDLIPHNKAEREGIIRFIVRDAPNGMFKRRNHVSLTL